MGKLVKHESSIDRLSGLPDSILSHILSFLPTKYAVRTSVLSTRWRYLYTSVTTLDFGDYHDSLDSFVNFVDRVLLFHDTTFIEKFRLNCYAPMYDDDDKTYRVYGWLSFALRRRVQELHLSIFMFHLSDVLPVSLFISKTLVKLVLQVSTSVFTIPTEVFLPSLKTLHLDRVNFVEDDSVRSLFSGCPVLEELVICFALSDNLSEINISNPSLKRLIIEYDQELASGPDPNIVINTPSLVNLKFANMLAVAESCLLVNLHSLVKAHLEYLFDGVDFNLEFAANLLKGISNVQSLCVTSDFLKPFSLCNKPLPVFYNLVRLEIKDSEYEFEFCEECELTEFLESLPNLEILIFYKEAFEDLTLNPSKKVPSCLLSSLKEIEIYSFGGQMKSVEYFLENSRVLEKLKIQMDMDLQGGEQSEIAKKLLMLPKESKKCQIEIV